MKNKTIKKTRDELIAPEPISPNRLTENEKQICFNESKRGASEAELMRYFNTSITEVRSAITQGEIVDERDRN